MKIFNKNEWKKVKLGDVCEVITGNTPLKKIKEYWDKDEVPFITPPELKYEGINYITPNIYVSKIGAKQGRIIPKNSICVCCIGSLGKLGILKEDAITNQQINSLILKDKNVDLLYLYFYLKTIKNNLESIASSTTVKIINKSSFEKIDINLPSLEIQKKISKKLELLENNINFRKSQLNSLNELSKSLFTKFNKNGVEKQLNDVADIIMGQSPLSQSYNKDKKGLPFYQGKTEFSDIYIKEATVYCNSPIKVVEENDILMSVRAPVGDVNIATQKSCIGRGLASIKPKKIDYLYLFYLLKEQKSKIEKIGVGSTFKAINKNNISTLKISIVEKDKQNKIRNYLSSIEKLKFIFGRPLISTTFKNSYKRVSA
ncbi:restriction endonuclease subunit S [Fusobacterium periodonticum]|uniref:Type I restriction-modification enzyme S subunit n=1 Tax=Fusobacterium periodonticum 1_1_41FAA TaxID=469621 RepID=D6LFN0_9FUSO|nr:restriction endonuclease subunit S [Fusobacterium periodonticum]EFG28965.1 type I restriction modification DNA specificity domain protein [Fusobacterium periodonticum 1_1_41FAA]